MITRRSAQTEVLVLLYFSCRVPVSDPLPGMLGGGQLPIGASLVVAEAVALAPLGTTPVSVFPPYNTPRNL